MNIYKKLFMDRMDSENVKYTDTDENALKIVFNGENLSTIPVHAIFDDDGDVQFRCWNIANFKDKMPAGLVACNKLNTKYRWMKFYIDKDYDLIASIDATAIEANTGDVCMVTLSRMISIIDDSYPIFMKALWS